MSRWACALPGQPEIDIAVDPLEGTNLVATGLANAITVLAASEKGGLLHAPDTYIEKLCVGPIAAGRVDIRLARGEPEPDRRGARPQGRRLDRRHTGSARHEGLIEEVRATGARIKLISDGDLSAAISCAVRGTGVHAVMGIGGAPEGVITAPRCAAWAARSRRDSASATTRSAARAERMGTRR